jgi:hypothetical protein
MGEVNRYDIDNFGTLHVNKNGVVVLSDDYDVLMEIAFAGEGESRYCYKDLARELGEKREELERERDQWKNAAQDAGQQFREVQAKADSLERERDELADQKKNRHDEVMSWVARAEKVERELAETQDKLVECRGVSLLRLKSAETWERTAHNAETALAETRAKLERRVGWIDWAWQYIQAVHGPRWEEGRDISALAAVEGDAGKEEGESVRVTLDYQKEEPRLIGGEEVEEEP